jgi:hypothetical protein
MTPDASASQLRDVLLGRGAHFADPRVATDTLDDLHSLIDGLDVEARRHASRSLAALTSDPEVAVATGAALAVRRLGSAAAAQALVDRVLAADPLLDRPAAGFTAASRPTVRAELACSIASVLEPGDEALAEELLDAGLSQVDTAELAAGLAPRLPDLVVARARDWLDAESATNAGVLPRLARQWHRLALAGALRPWPAAASDAIRLAASWQHWDERDTQVLLRVMADRAPELTRPEGIDDGRRWCIVAGEPWSWTVWFADDGAVALEVLRSGPAFASVSVRLDAAQVGAWRRGGIEALDELVTSLRGS